MKSLSQTLTETSNAIEAEVRTKYRQFVRTADIEQFVKNELSQLARTELEIETSVRREAWLNRVFANLRLYHLAQTGEPASQSLQYTQKMAEVEVIDLLTRATVGERLRAMGDGTYEQLVRRLRAMANLEITLATSSAEYVSRFCLEYARLATNEEPNWLPLLLSIQTALQDSPLVIKAPEITIQKPNQQVIALPKSALRRPALSMGRERVVSFSAVLGLIIVSGMIWWGGPSWKKSGQAKEVATVVQPATQATALVSPAAKVVPVNPPAPPNVTPEQAGYYVIGVAAREEATAQAEAQTRQQQGLRPRVVYSSNWSGLTPNYYLVVYGVFANRADTIGFRKDLEKRGIKTYMMHSGKRVQP
jgi:hypothetical protein